MSDSIKHECGIALIRLKKPLTFYKEKYGTWLYGLNKLFLLMEKQHNRGQDGAGAAVLRMNPEPGHPYLYRERKSGSDGVIKVIEQINKEQIKAGFIDADRRENDKVLETAPFVGELLLGHLRYGTHSNNGDEFCHPFIRQNNWMSKSLVMAGNFNLTNNDELFELLLSLGQHPRNRTDTVTVMEKIGHFLDLEVEILYNKAKFQGLNKKEASDYISEHLDVGNMLRRAAKDFDGGYAMAGLIGHGDAFVLRDPNGIRPAYWYEDEELVVVTSEKPPIRTAFDIRYANIQEIAPGHALVIKKDGRVSMEQILDPKERRSCSFERIYFSRGTDKEIYRERKALGRLVTPTILKAINYDLENTVFSYIPNTAEVSFIGMTGAVHDYMNEQKLKQIVGKNLSAQDLHKILNMRPRTEKIAVKDAKLRTFITADAQRDDMVSHVYDTTYGVIHHDKDTLVVIDDSIVRGTTLRTSILRILDRLHPKKIIIVSSAPQIRYPDCYGIDMSKLKDFIAFKAAIALLKDHNLLDVIEATYKQCVDSIGVVDAPNYVKNIYAPFTAEEISKKIAELLTSPLVKAEVEVIYQSIEGLHEACPNHTGDWYFTGNFPTQGGNRVVNRSFMNFYEGLDVRAY